MAASPVPTYSLPSGPKRSRHPLCRPLADREAADDDRVAAVARRPWCRWSAASGPPGRPGRRRRTPRRVADVEPPVASAAAGSATMPIRPPSPDDEQVRQRRTDRPRCAEPGRLDQTWPPRSLNSIRSPTQVRSHGLLRPAGQDGDAELGRACALCTGTADEQRGHQGGGERDQQDAGPMAPARCCTTRHAPPRGRPPRRPSRQRTPPGTSTAQARPLLVSQSLATWSGSCLSTSTLELSAISSSVVSAACTASIAAVAVGVLGHLGAHQRDHVLRQDHRLRVLQLDVAVVDDRWLGGEEGRRPGSCCRSGPAPSRRRVVRLELLDLDAVDLLQPRRAVRAVLAARTDPAEDRRRR